MSATVSSPNIYIFYPYLEYDESQKSRDQNGRVGTKIAIYEDELGSGKMKLPARGPKTTADKVTD